ncbi:MAG: 30S ribosomal protein S4 [Clostridiales bacterium]|jgi:small subunit ribosomal protein S4|nr:30S ribosomal protein S4 [Clostridiales bacterium]
MARYTEGSCRLCRREGDKLFLKGQRCYSAKCALAKKSAAPGQHGQGRKKISEYGLQLREKQKTKRFYGVLEKQFRLTYARAERKQGKTGEKLLELLELRLDNVVYRLGLASSRAEARQLVTHGHFLLNGKKANIPSMTLKAGDTIAVKETSRKSPKFETLSNARPVPAWLTFNEETLTGSVVREPAREDVDLEVKETLIVELYSK